MKYFIAFLFLMIFSPFIVAAIDWIIDKFLTIKSNDYERKTD